eukprot:1032198-Lingulodinium_polyedra.AAC.1
MVPLVVPPGAQLRIFGDDLTDMYHQFVVSPARALRNHLRIELSQAEAEKASACEPDAGPGPL